MADYVTKIRTMEGDKQIDYNALANKPAVALPIAGGTMQGPIVLTSDPKNDMEAATKQYVDDAGTEVKQYVDNVFRSQAELDSLNGYLKIKATYVSTGNPAENVYFRGIPDVEDSLLRTNEDGEFFAAIPVGDYTLTFRPIIGESKIPDQTVAVHAKKVTDVDISIEAGTALKHITESNQYLVGADATTHNVMALGGGGSGGASAIQGGVTSYNAVASAGGGSGYIQTKTINFEALRYRMVTVTIGAGGAGVSSAQLANQFSDVSGNSGGATMVADSTGMILISANGGSGGEAKVIYNNGKTHDVQGGLGASNGASVHTVDSGGSYHNGLDVSFIDDEIDGFYVFGNQEYPKVAGGGFASVIGASSLADLLKSACGAGCNEDGSAVNGLGAGSGGLCRCTSNSVPVVKSYDGGSGAVFIE